MQIELIYEKENGRSTWNEKKVKKRSDGLEATRISVRIY